MKKTVGFISSQDPRDKKAWSGTYHKMFEALELHFKVIPLGPIEKSSFISGVLRRLDKIHQFLFKKKYNREHNYIRSKYYSKVLNNKLKNEKIDVIFSPASTSELAFLKTKIPVCKLEDATFKQLLSYYDDFSNFSKLSIIEAKFIDKKAVSKADFHILSSTWAQNSLIKDYSVSKNITSVIKFGANIDIKPSIEEIKNRDYKNSINLLFLGKYWKRKGGDFAFKVFEALYNKGFNVNFIVCGCNPPVNHKNLKVIPFLNKNNLEEFKKFNQVLYESHILILPTKADCTPIVFCEANAYGIPVITNLTGGIGSIIENGINGYALDLDATIKDYADKISMLISNKELFRSLSLTSRKKYEDELNWKTWGIKMQVVLNNLISD